MAKRDKISHHKPVKPRPQLNVFEAILCGFLWLSGLWRLFRIVAYCILLIHEVLCNFLIDTYLWTAKQIGRTAAHIVVSMWPLILSWANVLSLIFGGCCSNVYSLETLVKQEPGSGLLITFTQFLLTALLTWPAHFSSRHPPFFLKPLAVPLWRWIPNVLMFFAVNLLNNLAFGYSISVPVHIILRSGGTILTMLVGYAWGKRYTRTQVFSVVMLTVGIVIAALADAQAKGRISDPATSADINSEFIAGLALLFIAQLLSAIMGLYVQITYDKYGKHWSENLFYSHLLSIPLFSPLAPGLLSQFNRLLSSPPAFLIPSVAGMDSATNTTSTRSSHDTRFPPLLLNPSLTDYTTAIPPHLLTLALNAITQYACIRGVNLLAARTSAIGVSIVLNVRKLASLFISIWLFGNDLPAGVILGATVVFSSAGVWAYESQRLAGLSQAEREKKEQ